MTLDIDRNEPSQSRLAHLSQGDLQRILHWNQNQPEAIESCVHTLIGDNACRYPDAPAVCPWDGKLSYSVLDSFSMFLAHYLVDLGVHAEMFVPLCFEKSKWAVVAKLAISQARGACILLEPSYPRNRLASILDDIKATVLLVSLT